ncbi:MAG TPA: hypothetical protein VGA98_07840 [Allosphingosinicella sp.]|jgi:hypothetical protein
MQLDVHFDTWKKLTSLLADEQDTHDAVIRRLLEAAPDTPPASAPPSAGAKPQGAYFKEVFLPEGTQLRASHKGKTYFAKISGSEWIDEATGAKRSSPSQAAYYITNNHVNGWLFWLVRRPDDDMWHSLNALRSSQP